MVTIDLSLNVAVHLAQHELIKGEGAQLLSDQGTIEAVFCRIRTSWQINRGLR